MIVKIEFWLTIFFVEQIFASDLLVQLPNGKVKGLSGKTTAGNAYDYFLHLRYAKAPVGNLRFERPQELDPWDDVFDGTTEKNICYQVYQDDPRENEDCLFLHLFTPKNLTNTVTADLPVMVFIHGGAFAGGDNSIYKNIFGPNFFIDSNVILVTVQYRLGVFGFLSLGDKVIPGNLALHDLNMALLWVQKNIQYFGGNPDKVTVFGQSSGAACLSYQVLSPRSKGLFAGAIMQSSTALVPGAYQRDQTLLSQKTVQQLPGGAEVVLKNSVEVLEFLKNCVTADQIDKASFRMASAQGNSSNTAISQGFFFAPVIEVEHEHAFLTERQYAAMQKGHFNKVPIIMGFNSEESVGMDLSSLDLFRQTFQNYDDDYSNMVPYNMHISNQIQKYEIGYHIHHYHVGNGNFSENPAAAIKLDSTLNFDKGIIKSAQLQSPHTPIYFYQFNYSGLMGDNQYRLYGTNNVTHAEELNYLFSHNYSAQIPDNSNLTYFPQKDIKVHNFLMTLWTNFAKYQNPTPYQETILQNTIWPKVDCNNFKYLDIGENLKVKCGFPKRHTFNFWQNLYDKYAVPPLDTF